MSDDAHYEAMFAADADDTRRAYNNAGGYRDPSRYQR